MTTLTVTAQVLNVRLFPWTGSREPPILRLLRAGTRVVVCGVYQPAGLAYGWACISPDGGEWVSCRYLEAAK